MSDIVQLITADEAVSRANFNQRLADINTKVALGDINGKALEALKLSGIEVLTADKTIYVRKTGNDNTGDGSNEKPFLSIQKAIKYTGTLAGEHSVTIKIGDGTYTENIIISYSAKTIRLAAESQDAEKVIIQPANPSDFLILAQYCKWVGISYLTFNGLDMTSATLVRFSQSNAYLGNCIFKAKSTITALSSIMCSKIHSWSCTFNNAGTALAVQFCGQITYSASKGFGNKIGAYAEDGIIQSVGSIIPATTAKSIVDGGLILP